MVCFNDFRSEFVVKVLAVLQFLLKAANVTGAVLSLIAAWNDEQNGSSSSRSQDCQCVLHSKPYSCELIENDGDKVKVSLWDLLFVISCLWAGSLNFLGLLRDVRLRTNRLLNSMVFLLSGSIYVGLGDHYDRDLLSLLGYISCVFALVSMISVPICGRVREVERDEESQLLDNDEFAQGNGVFSRLGD